MSDVKLSWTPNAIIESPELRKLAYKIVAALGLAFGAAQVAYLTAQVEAPMWLTVSFAVYGFLATGMGITAASNTPRPLNVGVDVEFVDPNTGFDTK